MAQRHFGDSLSSDVESDGEPFDGHLLMPTLESAIPSVYTFTKSEDNKMAGFRPVSDFTKSSKQHNQFDSGFKSISPYSSFGESMMSIPENVSKKAPIQCSDESHAVMEIGDITQLEESLNNLTVKEDDEGIISYTRSGHSLENFNLRSTNAYFDATEIDLYDTDKDVDTLIHIAIVQRKADISLALIDLADDSDCLDIQNELFQTPLHLAVLTDQTEIAKRLVAKGADVSLCDKQGNTPFHIACRKGDTDIVKVLVDSFKENLTRRKHLFGMKNCEGLSCVHLAAQNKYYDIMEYLFSKGADVNIGDTKSGRTMLHFAVERRDLDTVEFLLTQPEVNIDCKTYKGETPLVMAFWRNYQDVLQLLKLNGAYFSYTLFDDSDDEMST